MNTKNVKTAIIVMLVMANIFFLWKIYILNAETSRLPQQMIEDAAKTLTRGGLNILNEEIVPDIKPQNYIYEGEYSSEIFEEIAKSISESEITNTFLTPEGTSYNAGDYKFTFPSLAASPGESPNLEVDYFKISITKLSQLEELEKSAAEAYDIYKNYDDLEKKTESLIINGLKGYKRMDIAKAEKAIENFLKKYQTDGIDFETVGYQKNDTSIYIVIRQKLDGLAFNSHTVFAEISDGKVLTFSGKWYFGAFVGRYKMPLLDAVNILFKCLEKDESITAENIKNLIGVDLYYSILWHERTKFYLIPTWRISFDDGAVLSYSAVTGNAVAGDTP